MELEPIRPLPPQPDLLVGEDVYKAFMENPQVALGIHPRFVGGVSVEKNAWLPPDMIVGMTEVGQQIVRNCKEAAEAREAD